MILKFACSPLFKNNDLPGKRKTLPRTNAGWMTIVLQFSPPPPSHMISSIKGCFFLVDFLTLEDDFTAQIAVNVTKKITML